MDYADWPLKSLKITRLQLDPENPRLATSVSKRSQRELIQELIDHEDVLGLLSDIAKKGYFPNEVLVAVKERSRHTIVEGNRRLAALKLLANPELAPEKHRTRVRGYAKKRKPIETVPVVVAPDRDEAVPIIIARHDGSADVKSWSTVMQARFVQSRMKSGRSIDQVADETGLSESEVRLRFQRSVLSDVIQSLDLEPSVYRKVSDPRAFPFSTLDRFMQTSAVKKALKLRADDEHGLRTGLPEEAFKSLITEVVSDVAKGVVTSRSHNTAKQIEKYLDKLETKVAKVGRGTKGGTPLTEMVDPSRTVPRAAAHRKSGSSKKKRKWNKIVPKGFVISVENTRIKEVAEELRSLPIDKYPNSVALLFRSLLEMSISKHLHESGDLAKIKKKLSKKSAKSASWSPTLAQMLEHVRSDGSFPIAPEARKAISKFKTDTKTSITLDTMNGYAHNRYVQPSPDELRSFWSLLEPVLIVVLRKAP